MTIRCARHRFPVSLIRCEYIPLELREPIPPNNNNFRGINKSPVFTLGTLSKIIKVEGIEIKLCFLIISNETMSYAAFDHDFFRNPLVKVELNDTVKVSKRCASDEIDFINEIMRIEYVETPIRINEEFNISSDCGSEWAEKIRQLFYNAVLLRF